nr:unnamed protein product [Digitaria exilis]
MALLLLPFFLLLSSSPSVQAQQNITLGSSLTPQSSTSSWLSPSGDFAFGFRPVDGNTSSYLLAVWFNKISNMTVVWYAKNTEEDASVVQVSSSSRLQLTSSGALSLQDPTGTEPTLPCSIPETLYWLLQMDLPNGKLSKTLWILSYPVRCSILE